MGSKASLHGDVYSYGILLTEMSRGRRLTENIFKDGLNLHLFTKTTLPKKVMEIIEPSILLEAGGGDDNIMGQSKTKECLIAVLEIGVSCSKESPQEQMDMRA